MSLRHCARAGLVFGFLVSVSMGASCYRAQIDLTPLADEMAEAGGGASLSSAGEPSTGGTGEPTGGAPEPGSGGMSAPSDGGAGQPSSGAAACDTTPMDPAQRACRLRSATAAECSEQAQPGWAGCYAGGCKICVEAVVDYPHYFDWHPCCQKNPTCSVHAPIKCNALCPEPTELDKVLPCFAVNL